MSFDLLGEGGREEEGSLPNAVLAHLLLPHCCPILDPAGPTFFCIFLSVLTKPPQFHTNQDHSKCQHFPTVHYHVQTDPGVEY